MKAFYQITVKSAQILNEIAEPKIITYSNISLIYIYISPFIFNEIRIVAYEVINHRR